VNIKNVFEPKFYQECVLDRLPLGRHTRTVYRRDAENAQRFAIEMKPRLGLGHSVPVNATNRMFQKVRSALCGAVPARELTPVMLLSFVLVPGEWHVGGPALLERLHRQLHQPGGDRSAGEEV
jgi:hypothetical protein